MRELTKSMLSLSWAMSLLGLKQMASLLTPGSNAGSSFEAITRCTEEQLGPSARPAFRAGDSIQRGLVDFTFTLLTFGFNGSPRCRTPSAGDLTARAMGAGIDLMQQGVDLASQMAGGTSGQPSRNTGWGPVPPPPGGGPKRP